MSEFMMTGLRLTHEGVKEEEFQARFGKSMGDVYGKEIDHLLKLGLLEPLTPIPTPQESRLHEYERAGEVKAPLRGIRLTRQGRLLGNQVFMRFL